MKVISVNVGLPRTVQWKGKAVSIGIFKAPCPVGSTCEPSISTAIAPQTAPKTGICVRARV
jgi:hypothetical protein